jgi:Sortase domain
MAAPGRTEADDLPIVPLAAFARTSGDVRLLEDQKGCSIKNLEAGDEVDVVRADGSVAKFAVDGVQKVVKAQFSGSDVYGNTPYPSLRLITCGGPFDAASGEYLDNIVVYAHLTGVLAG